MHTEKFLNNFKQSVTVDGQQKIYEFFIVFSRFECALKKTNYVIINRNKVSPNWERFTQDIKLTFDKNKSAKLNHAVDYLMQHPPKIQTMEGESLVWRERRFEVEIPLTSKLGLHIRTIRNNLFHGGKFVGVYEPDVSRNYILIQSSLVILNDWLDINENLRSHFLNDM